MSRFWSLYREPQQCLTVIELAIRDSKAQTRLHSSMSKAPAKASFYSFHPRPNAPTSI